VVGDIPLTFRPLLFNSIGLKFFLVYDLCRQTELGVSIARTNCWQQGNFSTPLALAFRWIKL